MGHNLRFCIEKTACLYYAKLGMVEYELRPSNIIVNIIVTKQIFEINIRGRFVLNI